MQEPIHVPEHEHVLEAIAEDIQRHPNFRQQRNTLRYLYQPLQPPSSRPCDHLQTFRPVVGQFANGGELEEINNPQHMDIDVASFMMLS